MPYPEDINKPKPSASRDEPPVELENQFILRLPPTPAAALRAAVRSGVMNLKERLTIQLEPDVRHGTVKFDKWCLSAKVVDLPCLIESHKTLDRKTFYKTADICQIMICREEDELSKTDEEESPKKKDKKDSKDKKFLWPHGITPPLKNVRKRRFRKTLKKKYVDFPEIEKEVKRLFRMDNEAINVRYEVVNADDEKAESHFTNPDGTRISGSMMSPRPNALLNSNSQSFDVAEHDIFGEALSSSEDDLNIVDSGDEDNSRMFPTNIQSHNKKAKPRELVTEFSKGMLDSPALDISDQSQDQDYVIPEITETAASETLAAEQSLNQLVKTEADNSMLLVKLAELEQEIADIQARRQTQEMDIATIENQALKQRFQSSIDILKSEEVEKQQQYDEVFSLLQHG